MEADSKRWKVGYEIEKKVFPTSFPPASRSLCYQTLYGQYEHKFQGFDMKVKQRVPDGSWSVVPSPEIEVETKLVDKPDMSDSLELKYDCQKRLGMSTDFSVL